MTVLLADRTTLRLGGPAGQLLTHTDPSTWEDIVHTARRHRSPPLILGSGSNIIAADHGYPGPVIRIATRGIQASNAGDSHVDLTIQGGELLDEAAGFAAASGLSGIEYLAGIPGTAGAAPVQNTGAYGQQISDTLTAVTAYDWQAGRVVTLPAAHCGLAHRNSMFKTSNRWTILAVTVRLRRTSAAAPVTYPALATALGVTPGTTPSLSDAINAVRADRAARGLSLPVSGPDARQAGSVFVNPVITPRQAHAIQQHAGPVHGDQHGQLRASAGWLLQHAGFKPGIQIAPGVHCSAKRTLTIVARGPVTTTTYLKALARAATEVRQASGITLTIEPDITSGQLDRLPA